MMDSSAQREMLDIYQQLVVDYLLQYGQATRRELDDLVLAKLPDVLDSTQRQNKVRNLLQAMRRQGQITRTDPRAAPIWMPHVSSEPFTKVTKASKA